MEREPARILVVDDDGEQRDVVSVPHFTASRETVRAVDVRESVAIVLVMLYPVVTLGRTPSGAASRNTGVRYLVISLTGSSLQPAVADCYLV